MTDTATAALAPNYIKTIRSHSTFNDGNIQHCNDADITVEESGTGIFKGLVCSGRAKLTCVGDFIFGSTLVIDTLACSEAEISVDTSSTIDIKNINCNGTVTVIVNNSSTLRIRAGSLNIVNGEILNASTGVCRSSIKTDNVEASGGSTWDAA